MFWGVGLLFFFFFQNLSPINQCPNVHSKEDEPCLGKKGHEPHWGNEG